MVSMLFLVTCMVAFLVLFVSDHRLGGEFLGFDRPRLRHDCSLCPPGTAGDQTAGPATRVTLAE
jgi:hypothetical protein